MIAGISGRCGLRMSPVVLSAIVALLITFMAAPADAAPARPKAPTAKANYSTLTLTWRTPPPRGARFQVTWQQGGKKRIVRVNRPKSGPARVTIRRLVNGTAYKFRVRTVKGRQVSKWRTFTRATKARNLGPIANNSIRLTPVAEGVRVNWTKVKYAKAYWVTWTPQGFEPPRKPGLCTLARHCQKKWVRGTNVTLSSQQLSLPGSREFRFRVRSASGNSVRFRFFAVNRGKVKLAPSSAFRYSGTPANGWLPTRYSSLPAPLPEGDGHEMKIASFNILTAKSSAGGGWVTRRGRVIEQIKGTGAEIVGLQEASHGIDGVPQDDQRPHEKISQVKDLDAALPANWSTVDVRRWDDYDEHGDDVGANNNSSQGARIIYRSDLWSLDAHGVFLTGDIHLRNYRKSDAVQRLRHVSWAKFERANDSDTELCVLSAHLQPNGTTGTTAARKKAAVQRDKEMDQIRAMIDDPGSSYGQSCHGVPTAFTGDFNAAGPHLPHSNGPVTDLIVHSGFVDTRNATKRVFADFSTTGGFQPLAKTRHGSQIDYVLTRGMSGAKEFRVNWVQPDDSGSDHRPVTATVRVPKNG